MTREEAIQNIKKAIGFSDTLDESIFTLFPELRESEDERIREFICSIIDNLEPKDFVGVKKMNVLAWLEKQKEQKPSINIDQLKSLMLQYLQEAANKKEDSDIEADTDKWARKILGYDFEQKPITINQDEKEFLADEITAFLCNYDKEFDGEDPVPSEIAEHFYLLGKQAQEQKQADEQFPPLEGLDAIKAKYYDNGFKNGFDEGVESVKPAEWSEDDERRRDGIIQWLREYQKKFNPEYDSLSIESIESLIAWLKSLKDRGNFPKSNTNSPSEWSEEDEKMRKSIIWVLESFVSQADCESNPSFTCSYPTYYKEIDWFKSLRSQLHWKPSEEQIEYLSKAILTLGEEGDGKTAAVLNELRKDLKKLMEE